VIQHLLFLREQIAQFDVEFSVTDIDLDFTHMRDHMRRIMSGRALPVTCYFPNFSCTSHVTSGKRTQQRRGWDGMLAPWRGGCQEKHSVSAL
jgi:hypothetical protein